MMMMMIRCCIRCCCIIAFAAIPAWSLIPLIDGGKGIPKLYDAWMNGQIAKQARTAVAQAIGSGKKKIEVNFPPGASCRHIRICILNLVPCILPSRLDGNLVSCVLKFHLLLMPSTTFSYSNAPSSHPPRPRPVCLSLNENHLSSSFDAPSWPSFFSVPNVEEVRFGTPLNQKFGTSVVAKELGVPGGYKPGSDVSRQLIGFSNMYWAKEIAPAISGIGKRVSVITAEPVVFNQLKRPGVDFVSSLSARGQRGNASVQKGDALIVVNPGGEETWEKIYATYGSPTSPIIILNNAYSTTYDLGNKRGFEEGTPIWEMQNPAHNEQIGKMPTEELKVRHLILSLYLFLVRLLHSLLS